MTARVIGLVSWWDESPTWLGATIASMSRFCDHVVALDGRYAMFPDQRMQSGAAEVQTIIETARAAGLGLTLHTAPRTFQNEMDKRTHLFRLGQLEARTGKDWFYVLDGDEVTIESPPREQVLAFLDDTTADAVVATLFERTDPHESEWRTDLGMKLQTEWRYESRSPRFWRVHDNMRVVGYHFNYVGENAAGETVELWGMDGAVSRTEWASLCGRVIIENRNRLRGKQRDADRQSYYDARDQTGLETIAPLAELEGATHAGR
jgi:hypothetical protein